jgi:hypothetical protein
MRYRFAAVVLDVDQEVRARRAISYGGLRALTLKKLVAVGMCS